MVDPAFPPRAQPTVWMHATSAERRSALTGIARRLLGLQPQARCVLTHQGFETADGGAPSHDGLSVLPLPEDTNAAARAFLAEWRPALCLWTGGDLKPAMIAQAQAAGVRLVLLDADPDSLSPGRRLWFQDPVRQSLARFDLVLTSTPQDSALLRRAGARTDAVETAAPLCDGAIPPPCDDGDLADVSASLGARPVWLAAHLQAGELDTLLSAQRSAVRLSHRLLMVMMPDDPAETAAMAAALDTSGLRWSAWEYGDTIDDNAQVLLVEDPEQLGLWYRLSPLSFIGCSLVQGAHGRSPLAAAALGSAVIYGPNVRTHLAAYSRLAAAGAARIVRDAETLSAAVVHLIAPDRAAGMALAGWEVATQGAALTDRIVAMAGDILDARIQADAGA